MMEHPYRTLEDVVSDDLFPEADMALRRGRHVDQEDTALYTFLADAQAFLEPFYRRFGGELVRSTDGYFYLLPLGRRGLPRRSLPNGAMLAGQALALLFLDPAVTVKEGGVLPRGRVLEVLASLLGERPLLSALNPRRRSRHAHVDEGLAREELDKGLKLLEDLGFVDLLPDGRLKMRPPLLRFTDPVRESTDPKQALAMLVAGGRVEVEA